MKIVHSSHSRTTTPKICEITSRGSNLHEKKVDVEVDLRGDV